MSVYTEVGRDELIAFLGEYAVGDLIDYQGITAGIENTNYFVTTDQGEFVLTLFEQHGFAELDYYLEVMTFFFKHGIPSAHPAADKQGNYLRTLCERPAALVMRLPGHTVDGLATLEQCAAIGEMLAKMHLVGQQFSYRRVNQRGAEWRESIAEKLLSQLPAAQAEMLQAELAFQASYSELALPWGVTHSDLFRDNALFIDNQLQGIIDFYYACDEFLIYDLAVTVNDWCVDEQGVIDPQRYQRLMQAYLQHRQLNEAEQSNWNLVCRAAALRFWLSRLQDQLFPREGEITHIKNPDAFLTILQQHRDNPLPLDMMQPA